MYVCMFLIICGLPRWHRGWNLPVNAGDVGVTPGSRRSPGGGRGNPLQCSCLENPTDRRVLQATVQRVEKSWTWLSD